MPRKKVTESSDVKYSDTAKKLAGISEYSVADIMQEVVSDNVVFQTLLATASDLGTLARGGNPEEKFKIWQEEKGYQKKEAPQKVRAIAKGFGAFAEKAVLENYKKNISP